MRKSKYKFSAYLYVQWKGKYINKKFRLIFYVHMRVFVPRHFVLHDFRMKCNRYLGFVVWYWMNNNILYCVNKDWKHILYENNCLLVFIRCIVCDTISLHTISLQSETIYDSADYDTIRLQYASLLQNVRSEELI